MKRCAGLVLIVAAGCRTNEPKNTVSENLKPQPAVALIGEWLRVAPEHLKGDTLRLRADSTAEGIIPWSGNKFARVSHWRIRYMSKDPLGTRQDWRQGYTDGGDAECMREGEPGCVSLPTLCLGAAAQYSCEAFALTPDSLLVSSGLQYVRLTPIATTPDLQRPPSTPLPQSQDGALVRYNPERLAR